MKYPHHCFDPYPDPNYPFDQQPRQIEDYPYPPPPRPPCHVYNSAYYKYSAIAVLSLGGIALVIIIWRCCRDNEGGRVLAQAAPQPAANKPSSSEMTPPPPYNVDAENPPPYNACVPEEYLQQQAYNESNQRISDPSIPAATTTPTLNQCTKGPSAPTTSHVVDMLPNKNRY